MPLMVMLDPNKKNVLKQGELITVFTFKDQPSISIFLCFSSIRKRETNSVLTSQWSQSYSLTEVD